ncbi:MAG: hypothetical protein IT337_03690 [Thermomicrobiales bacterium]|nr:hypothetical protein [Thermomicrobiales bacterium]
MPEPLPKPGGTQAALVGAAPAPAAPKAAATPEAGAAAEPAATVKLTPDFAFDPAKVSIKKGQAVRWVNEGRSPQTVTGDPARVSDKSQVSLPDGAKPWDSGVLNSGAEFTQTFDVAGTYHYASMNTFPKVMTGEVDVQG